ncbi:MAG: hypothetical protein JKY22_03015 [Flavobacteriaceae bacterium]|nr:hypothetical protein [Flavobacteriaceae bacterium]
MSKFALKKIKTIKGNQSFYDLEINGVGQFDSFSKEAAVQYESELLTLNARMDLVANLVRLPKQKFKDITPVKEQVKEYEFKTRHLRLYVTHIEKTGKVVILGGYKNTQKKDFRRFRSLKKQYLKTLKK